MRGGWRVNKVNNNMKNTFRHYHQFTKEELIQLNKDCIYVLDTNILLIF